jgi:hypothetical protein
MARPRGLIPGFLGFTVQGDLGPWTFYTSARGKLVFYPAAPALSPASPDQSYFRQRFKAAALAWRQLTASQRAQWQKAAKAARLRISGYHLWTRWICKQELERVRGIEHYTGITLIFQDGSYAPR